MAYLPHALVAFVGDYSNASLAAESWQFGVRVFAHGDPSPSFLDDPQAYADNIASDIDTWFGAVHGIPNYCRLQSIKVNNIDPDGHYADPVTHQHDYSTPPTGPNTSAFLPPQCTVVWSWTTDVARGPAHGGRVYPPTSSWSLAAGAVLSSTQQGQSLDDALALLDILGSQTDTGSVLVTPCVASSMSAMHSIEGVRVGAVVDTQRRRRNQLPEAYVSSVWPAP
uniref:Uncharacterized protein n=1 Tax=uncultured prokaryote TaxID=198431 RepID=A0A0H5QNJ3_9ZZZZ|nr:hypothetical protein [uncultured prokaryote]